MDLAAFALTAALAQVLSNIDNLILALALGLTAGRGRALGAYVLAQVSVLMLALGLGAGLGQVMQAHVRWLGLLPLALGVFSLLRSGGPDQSPVASRLSAASGRAWLPLAVLTFLGLSMDSLTLMTPLLAESRPAFRGAALIGALCGIGTMTALASLAGRRGTRLVWLERLVPWVLILAGLYVVWDSGTDLG